MFYGGRDECIKHYEVENQSRMFLPGVLIGQTEIDACTAALQDDQACGLLRSYAECKWIGSEQQFTACNDDSQCASGHCSAKLGTCGSCVPTLALGDDCSTDQLGCGVGMFCGETTKKCVKRIQEGASCANGTSYWSCEDGLGCIAGTCQSLKAEGALCDVGQCARGLDCNAGTCAKPPASYQKVAPGQPCPADEAAATCAKSTCGDDQTCAPVVLAGPAPEICQ